jgi:hypothetical protein
VERSRSRAVARRLPLLVLVTLFVLVALAPPADAHQARRITLRFPRFRLSPGANRELCVLVRLKRVEPLDVASWTIEHRAPRGMSVRHFLVYAYGGERLTEVAAGAGRIVESRGCLDVGPVDRDRRVLVASGASILTRVRYPSGVALRLMPVSDVPGGPAGGVALLLDANWVNASTRTRTASTKVILERPKRGSVRRRALPFSARTPELGLSVSPGQLRSTEDSTAALNAARPGEPPVRDVWQPAADACVVLASGQMHERGRLFALDLLGSDGQPRNPADGFSNPFEPGRNHVFATADYTDPGSLGAAPLLLRAGEALHPLCWHDNGVEKARRLGCEESPGVAPGGPPGLGGLPAKPCTIVRSGSPECPPSDPAYPGRAFTGACALANLVAGETPADEVCGVTGLVYDAVPGASDTDACTVTGLPPLP